MDGISGAKMTQTHIFSPLDITDINACRRIIRGINYRLVSYFFDPSNPDEAALSFEESVIVTNIKSSICANQNDGLLLHAMLALVEQEHRVPEDDDKLLLMMHYVAYLAPKDHLLYPRIYVDECERARTDVLGPNGFGRVFTYTREELAFLAPAAFVPLTKENTSIEARRNGSIGGAFVGVERPQYTPVQLDRFFAPEEAVLVTGDQPSAQTCQPVKPRGRPRGRPPGRPKGKPTGRPRGRPAKKQAIEPFHNTTAEDMAREYNNPLPSSPKRPPTKRARRSASLDSVSSLSTVSSMPDPFSPRKRTRKTTHAQEKESENDAGMEYNNKPGSPVPGSSIAEEEVQYEGMSDAELNAYHEGEIKRQNLESSRSIPIPCPHKIRKPSHLLIPFPNTPPSRIPSPEPGYRPFGQEDKTSQAGSEVPQPEQESSEDTVEAHQSVVEASMKDAPTEEVETPQASPEASREPEHEDSEQEVETPQVEIEAPEPEGESSGETVETSDTEIEFARPEYEPSERDVEKFVVESPKGT